MEHRTDSPGSPGGPSSRMRFSRAHRLHRTWQYQRAYREGRSARVYLARRGTADVRLKILRANAVRDQCGLQRYFAHSRLVSRVGHIGLPKNLSAERSGETNYVAHDMVEGQTLASRMAWAGPLHFNEVRPLLVSMLEALRALHVESLCHGDLHAENVILTRSDSGDPSAVLVDAGSERLRTASRSANGTLSSSRIAASQLTISASSDAHVQAISSRRRLATGTLAERRIPVTELFMTLLPSDLPGSHCNVKARHTRAASCPPCGGL